MAAFDVISADCIYLNPNDSDYINYRKSASKLLTVMEINYGLYNETYKTIYTNSRSDTEEETRRWCEELRPAIVMETVGMAGDYELALQVVNINKRERAEAWVRALEAATIVAEELARSAQSANYTYSYIPMPTSYPTFGHTTANHYNSAPKVFSASECFGPVVSGKCHGRINPVATSKRCLGGVIYGRCIGPTL